MINDKLVYPDLYIGADRGAARAQVNYIRLVRLEYSLLFLVSVLSAARSYIEGSEEILTIALVLLGGLFVLKVFKRIEENWYRCRALAESVKTSTWRFAMRSHPFEHSDDIEVPKAKFRNFLRQILKSNQSIAEHLDSDVSDQVTESMIATRELSIEERRNFYLRNRVDEQRVWYTKKSAQNRRALHRWVYVTILIYLCAVLSVYAESFGFTEVRSAFDPLIVLAAAGIGWIQMRRYGELTASYNLTAQEIGLIKGQADSIESEGDFSDFVNEAELAFSREHTQWVARRDAT